MRLSFNKNNIFPDKDILVEALMVGILTTLIFFLIDFFTWDISFIPKGWEVFAIVLLAVYVKHLIIIRMNGRVFM